MAKLEDLQQEVEKLRAILERAGIAQQSTMPPEHMPDYIAHGSPEHATFLGLCEVEDVAQAAKDRYTVYTSQRTGKSWRLEDEIGAVRYYPGVDPDKAILLVLRQKINVLEGGAPPIPKDAPSLLVPGVFA